MSVVTIRDQATGSWATIAPARGFNCYQFEAAIGNRRVDVISSVPGFETGTGSPSQHGIPILFPFPNRIREGRYKWDGRDYQLPLTEGHPNALHGFCLNRTWRIVDQQDASVTGRFQLSVDAPERRELWPCDFIIDVRYAVSGIIDVRYAVSGAALSMEVTVSNPDRSPLPWGFGTHAYFKLPLGGNGKADECLVRTPAQEEWILEDGLPTGERRSVSELTDLRSGAVLAGRKLDHVLTDFQSTGDVIETSVTDPSSGLRIVQSFPRDFRELVVFTPSWADAVCMEPYTCVTDAVNLQRQGIDAGWRTLAPGAEFRTQIVIRVETT